VLDLFSGCGGLSLGFHRAGCDSVAGVELDADAARSHALNFHRLPDGSPSLLHATARDITKLEPLDFIAELGLGDSQAAVDVLVGGPPCPAFTRVGRAKLREVAQHPEAFKLDPRAQLYVPYLRFVRELKPLAVVMENVPDFLNWGGHNLGEEICETLEGLGYNCVYTLLNAASYGVPQMRERFFLVATHKALGDAFEFPAATCAVKFPPGYQGSRNVALKHVGSSSLFERSHFVATPRPSADARGAVSVQEAIGDLPRITGHLEGTIRRGARRFNVGVDYPTDAKGSAYANELRCWPGFEGGPLFDHVIRTLSERDFALFRAMQPNDDYPKAYALAESLFEKALKKAERAGRKIREGTVAWDELRSKHVPPYDPSKFPNKWRKMAADEPARTLMAHLGKDTYSHIHYDSEQARVISVREAARLQSFPDGFKFSGTMNPAFRQIGNAVPPLLVFRALAAPLVAKLRAAGRRPTADSTVDTREEAVSA
jgi:DNA (cytosine-5)-methyltransferase 1